MDIGLLGPLHVDHDVRVLGPRDRVVLSALAVSPGSVVSPERLADALWPDVPPDSWSKVVQGCVVRLRKVLGADAVETSPHGYRLVTAHLGFDTAEFARLVRLGNEEVLDGVPERAVATYERALGLWRGLPFEELQEWDDGRQETERLLELRRSCEEELLAARLAGGARSVTADAQALVAAEPWRERRWAVLALAQYREGRQADALTSIRRASRALQEQLGLDAGAELQGLETAILNQDPALDEGRGPGVGDEGCPWKGLAAYDVDDRDAFHGREEETAECLTRLVAHPVLVLAGPSGCGKSSLLRAGVVPLLRDRAQAVVVMVPGPDPAATMAAALSGLRGDPVLVVDQFEEVFTLRDDPLTAAGWLAELASYAVRRAPVVVSVRADHLAELGVEMSFARLAEAGLHLVSPLTGDRLRAAIEGPARSAGLRLEHGLVELLLRDTEGEPGALPLLSHALTETWLRREGRLLTVAGYREAGGIRGAVARSADRLYEELAPIERSALRWTLLRLVATSPDGEPFRTRLSRSGLAGDETRERIVDLLAASRLVTVSENAVELAHEALARAWPRLRAWLDEDASGQRIWRHLAASAEGWDALGRPESELYRGARLEATEEWLRDSGADVTPVETAFLETSLAQETTARRAIVERARRQAAQNSRLRILVGGVALLLVAALLAGLVAIDRGRTAARERDAASRERDAATRAESRALHGSLVSSSLSLRTSNRGLAALLAVTAYRERPDASARSALLGTFTYSPGFLGYRVLDAQSLNGVLIPGTHLAAVADRGDLQILDLGSWELDRRFRTLGPEANGLSDLRVSGDGRRVVQQVRWAGNHECDSLATFRRHDGRGCTRFAVYDVRSGRRLLGPVPSPFGDGDLQLNRDGSLLAFSGGYAGDVAVLRVSDGRREGFRRGARRPHGARVWPATAAIAFARDGRHLYAGSMTGTVSEISTRSYRVTRTFSAPRLSSTEFLRPTRSGDLVVGGQQGLARIDVRTGRLRWHADLRADRGAELAADPCALLVLAERRGRFYCGNGSGQIVERDLSNGGRTGRTFDSQIGKVADLAVSADDRTLLVFPGEIPFVSRWRLDGSGPITRLVAAGRVAVDGYAGGLLPTMARAALSSSPAPAPASSEVWDAARGRKVDSVRGTADLRWVGEGQLAVLGSAATPRVYDVHTHRLAAAPYLPRNLASVWRSADGRRVLLASTVDLAGPLTRFHVDVLDTSTHRRVGHRITVDAYDVLAASITPDDTRLLVTSRDPYAWPSTWYDLATGVGQYEAMSYLTATAIAPNGAIVGGDTAGTVTQFDPASYAETANFAGAGGVKVASLEFSADGSVLSVTAKDQTVHIYDAVTRLQLGDAISANSPGQPGWLRLDGHEIAVNVRDGVAIWSLDPEQQVKAACRLAGRNLTYTEWNTYVSTTAPYRRTCTEYGQPFQD